MNCLKTGFSLVSLAFCLGFVLDANAAPSVRVLGSGAGYNTGTTAVPGTTATGVKTGNTISSSVLGANAGAKKSASIKTIAPKTATVAPTPRVSSTNRPGTIATAKTATAATAASGSERFPGVVTKANIQNIGKVGTVATAGQSTTSGGGYNIKEMSDRLTGVEDVLGTKVDDSKLDDYYTKDEIDSNYYTAQQVEDRLANIDASASSDYIRFLTQTLNLHTEQIQSLAATDSAIYDANSGDRKNVYFETTFDADTVLGAE